MRLSRFHLLRYGPFSDFELDLSDGDQGLHLILGRNEAGKSSSLRALTCLLFGFEHKASDIQIHDASQLRVGGTVVGRNGDSFSFVRKRGRKNTILDPATEKAIEDSRLERFLLGVGCDEFLSMYGLNYERLVEGGRRLIEQRTDLGQTLFSAALGGDRLRAILESLQQEANALFRPTAPTTSVNLSRKRYLDFVKQSEDAVLRASDWKKTQRELREIERELKECRGEQGKVRERLSLLERVKRVRVSLQKLSEIRDEIESMGEVVRLPVGFRKRFWETGDSLRASRANEEKLEKRIQRRIEELEPLSVDEEFLARKDRIEPLEKGIGAYLKAKEDLAKAKSRKWQVQKEAKDQLAEFREGMTLEEVNTLKPNLARKEIVESQIHDLDKLETQVREKDKILAKLKKREKEIQTELEALPVSRDGSALTSTLSAARSLGDIDKRIDQDAARIDTERGRLNAALSQLGLWEGDLDKLDDLALPLDATLTNFAERFDGIAKMRGEAAQRLEDARVGLMDAREELESLEAKKHVPGGSDLREARDKREEGWQLIRRQWLDGEDTSSEVEKYTQGRDLPETYEHCVGVADEIADDMLTDAERVERKRALEDGALRAERRIAEQEGSIQKLEAERVKVEEEWRQVWQEVDIEPLSPAEMREWCNRVNEIRAVWGRCQKEMAELTEERERREAACASLCDALDALDESLGNGEGQLEPVLARAEQVTSDIREKEEMRRDLSKRLTGVREDIRETEQDREELSADRDSVRAKLIGDASWLGFSEEEPPKVFQVAIRQLEKVVGTMKTGEELEGRIRSMERDMERFEEGLRSFLSDSGLEVPEDSVEAQIEYLKARKSQQLTIQERKNGIENSLQEARDELEDVQSEVQVLQQRLDEYLHQAGVKDVDEVDGVIDRSERFGLLKSNEAQRLEELQDVGDGFGEEELRAQASGIDASRLPGEIDAANERVAELDDQIDQLRKRKAPIESRIVASDGSSSAAEAKSRAMEVLAQLRDQAETYLSCKAAVRILEEQIEKFRKEHQTPLLARASLLFSRLTLGSFKGLEDDLDEKGDPIIRGLRQSDKTVSLDAMSDGTSDQLYLALRLAALEMHLEQHEGLPIVLDDILIGFDDERSLAALSILAELSRKTQIILFTHHKRVAELSEKINSDAGVFLHELPAPDR